MTTSSTSLCRTCNAPLEWRDTPNGRRPYNPDGTPHSDRGSASKERDVGRAIARMSALRSAAIYCGHRSAVDETVKTDHIFVLAERMVAWLEKEATNGN